jgi:hypothetical protein
MAAAVKSMFKPEPLCAELQRYAYTDSRLGLCIKHPLVFSIMHSPKMNHLVNEQLAHKQEGLTKAMADGDWTQFVWLHERPYRLWAFQGIEPQLQNDTYWQLLGATWIDSENYFQNKRVWHEYLSSKRPSRYWIMASEDMDVLESLPDELTVYRGREPGDVYEINGGNYLSKFGPSWTLDYNIALKFAKRFKSMWRTRFKSDELIVFKATCNKADAIGYLNSRSEEEVLIFPRYLRDVQVTTIAAGPSR